MKKILKSARKTKTSKAVVARVPGAITFFFRPAPPASAQEKESSSLLEDITSLG